MIKIGVDARLLSRPLTGIGRYTFEMCLELSKNQDFSLFLYGPAPFPSNLVQQLETTTIRTGRWNNAILRQLWGSLVLPIWANKDTLDVFWGPSHRLPRLISSNTTLVVTIHDLVWKHARGTMKPLSLLRESYQMPSAINLAEIILADSKATKESLENHFPVSKDKTHVIHLGVKEPNTSLSKALLADNKIHDPYFLFVGTLEPRKNLERLLIAFSQLSSNARSGHKLVIAGGKGWGNINLNNTINRLGLESDVMTLGYVDDYTLNTLYKYSKFLVMPSLYEGFGLPLVEAMIHGVPVLTSNISSMPEVAGEAGFLVDPFDVNSIRQGLDTLINNETVRSGLASKAIVQAKRFTWENAALEFTKVIREFSHCKKVTSF